MKKINSTIGSGCLALLTPPYWRSEPECFTKTRSQISFYFGSYPSSLFLPTCSLFALPFSLLSVSSFFHFFFPTPSAPLLHPFCVVLPAALLFPLSFYSFCLNILSVGAIIHGIVVVKERISCSAKKHWSVHLWSSCPWRLDSHLFSLIVRTVATRWPLVVCPIHLEHLVKGREKDDEETRRKREKGWWHCGWSLMESMVNHPLAVMRGWGIEIYRDQANKKKRT